MGMADEQFSKTDLLWKMTDVVSAFVSNNPISTTDLPELMTSVHSKLSELANGEADTPRPEPAVPIKKSVTRILIFWLEDGKILMLLNRNLLSSYNLSPDEYRVRWGLPADYPMVAPEYADRRSRFAKEIGLGKKA